MHVLGMAKSSLCLKGAKASKLELDFFKLAFAVAQLRATNEQAVGYLQVLSAAARDRAVGWIAKYQTGDAVNILYAAPDDAKLVTLAAEKVRNAAGLLATPNADRASLSLASFGRELGESALLQEVLARHPTVERVEDRSRFPQRIDWDYYGVVPGPGRALRSW
jgi:hypothetical protein